MILCDYQIQTDKLEKEEISERAFGENEHLNYCAGPSKSQII